MSRHDPVLCFVRLPWAWFSFVPCDAPTHASRGWDEAYEGDAGNPAWPSQVLRVAISPNGLLTPNMMARPLDMRLSPVEINASRGGWLFGTNGAVVAHAGMPLSAFREALRERGAEVYEPSWHGRPAFNPNDPAPGNVRLYPSYPWPRKVEDGLHILNETKLVGDGYPFDIVVAMLDVPDAMPMAVCKIQVGDRGGVVSLAPPLAAALCVGLSRFVALADFDWDRCAMSSKKSVAFDGLTALVDITRDPAENARRIVAAWNEAAGYKPGEGARADGVAVTWPETTRHPAHARAEMAVHGADDDEPSVGDVEDAVVAAQVPPC